MTSHYEINVSLNGRHLFATAPRSFTDMTEAGYAVVAQVAQQLAAAFPGAQVTVTKWEAKGTHEDTFKAPKCPDCITGANGYKVYTCPAHV